MKIVVASASFKGSLSAIEASRAIAVGIKSVRSDVEVVQIPVSDGGEGLVENLLTLIGGRAVKVKVHDPLMRERISCFAILNDNTTAVIEMAAASGLTLLSECEQNALETTTYGTGELIVEALNAGCKNIVIGVGGSATIDGGSGALAALGVKFSDNCGNELKYGGGSLSQLNRIDIASIDKRIYDCNLTVICDVVNPLYGETGASRIFGKQKGATEEMIIQLDRNLVHFAKEVESFLGIPSLNIPHSGAAGGLSAGLFAFFNASLVNGINYYLKLVQFDKILENCDLVITGEGYLDVQTQYSKAPFGVALKAAEHSIPVAILTGSRAHDSCDRYKNIFQYVHSITDNGYSLDDAKESAYFYLTKLTKNFIKNYFEQNNRKTN